jgi:hypothetical protein
MNFEKYNLDRHKPLLGKRKILLYKEQGSPMYHLLNHINVTRIQKILMYSIYGGLGWRSGKGVTLISGPVPGSIPGGVTGFFNDIHLPTAPWPCGRLSPLVKMSIKNISWG